MSHVKIPKILIIGGGAGGLNLATRLGNSLGKKKKADITLVDENLSHMWKPSLHEFAAGTRGADEEISFLEHANRNHYNFRLGRFAGLDTTTREVALDAVNDRNNIPIAPRCSLGFDHLVIAIGSRSNDFGCKGVDQNCLFLDTPKQAKKLQTEILNLCLRLETGALGENTSQVSIGIIGGGATGVELAAELREATEQLARHGLYKLLDQTSVRISLVEAAPRLVAQLPETISEKVATRLQELNIDLHLASRVQEVTSTAIKLEGGSEIGAQLSIWAAGIKAPAVLDELSDLETGSLGRLQVRSTLQSSLHKCVFVMGDCAEFNDPITDKPLPPRAQVAAQQAAFLEKQFHRVVEQRPLLEFTYVDRGSLVAMSKSSAVGALMGKAFGTLTIEGWLARRAYRYLHFAHEAAVQGTMRAAFKTVMGHAMKRIRPQLKLH